MKYIYVIVCMILVCMFFYDSIVEEIAILKKGIEDCKAIYDAVIDGLG